jgi:hypothetical protein
VCSPAEVRFRHFVEGARSHTHFEVGPIDLGTFCDFNAIRAPGLHDGGIEGWTLNRGHPMNNGYDHLWLCGFCEEHHLMKSFAAFARIDPIAATEESEVQTIYSCRAVCRFLDEAHISAPSLLRF